MAKGTKTPLELGKRERQIYETIVQLGEASVSDVLKRLDQAPTYSAVRATIRLLVEKEWLKYREDGPRYLYRPAQSQDKNRRGAIQRLVSTFFGGSAKDALAALLDISAGALSDEDIAEMAKLIEQAKLGK